MLRRQNLYAREPLQGVVLQPFKHSQAEKNKSVALFWVSKSILALEPFRVVLKLFEYKVVLGKDSVEGSYFKCKQVPVRFSDRGFEAAIMGLLVVF